MQGNTACSALCCNDKKLLAEHYVENLRSLLDLFPWKNTVTTNTADSCKSFSLSLSQTVTPAHASVETNSNKRIGVLGTNHKN